MDINTSENKMRHQVKFHGSGEEYFSIWLVNTLLTAVTLGIYSAWATVRRRRYFYGNTEINGDRFDYHAQPMQILKGRLLVIGGIILFYALMALSPTLGTLILIALMGLAPWLIIRSWRYNALMSSYRGVRFNYHCKTGRAYWVLLFCPILLVLGAYLGLLIAAIIAAMTHSPVFITLLILAIVTPVLVAVKGIIAMMQNDLYVNNMFFGESSFRAELAKGPFIKFFLISLLIFIPFPIAGISLISPFLFSLLRMDVMGWVPENVAGMMLMNNTFNLIMVLAVTALGVLVSSSYLAVAQRNYLFNQTQINGDIKLRSTMQTMSYMWLLITNSLITVFSLGWATPVAEVRHARYLANATVIEGDLSLLNVHAHQDSANTAVAEEAVNAFDLNVGI